MGRRRRTARTSARWLDELRHRLRHFPRGVYIDVGARSGYPFWREELGLGHRGVVVHAFEPNPASMAELRPFALRFRDLHLHAMAVSLEDGKRRFHVTRNP